MIKSRIYVPLSLSHNTRDMYQSIGSLVDGNVN